MYEELIVAKKKGINALTASIETKIQRICELAISIVQMKNDLTDNKEALLGEKGLLDGLLREKEAAAFAALKADLDANVVAIIAAIAALERGMAGGFVQTAAAQVLRKLILTKQSRLDIDRQEILSFLLK